MAKTVGYACSIKMQWLKKAVEMLKDNLDETAYKQELNDYLAFEIDSPTRLRKTREILMNVWYYDIKEITPFRREALDLINKYPDDFAAINLCMLYLTYPVVADICKFMGRIFEYQDEITNSIIKQKLYDEWGERGSLESVSRRVTLTLKELNFLENKSRTRYILKKHEILSNPVISFILAVAMRIDGNSYYTFTDLTEFDEMFPFEYKVSKEYILMDPHFVSAHFGGEMTIALKE